MAKQGQTIQQANRAIRQETLREWLSAKCTGQHLIDNIEKIEGLDPTDEAFTNLLNKYKTANEQRLKILGYYLPALKGVEISGEGGGNLIINLVDYTDKDE